MIDLDAYDPSSYTPSLSSPTAILTTRALNHHRGRISGGTNTHAWAPIKAHLALSFASTAWRQRRSPNMQGLSRGKEQHTTTVTSYPIVTNTQIQKLHAYLERVCIHSHSLVSINPVVSHQPCRRSVNASGITADFPRCVWGAWANFVFVVLPMDCTARLFEQGHSSTAETTTQQQQQMSEHPVAA